MIPDVTCFTVINTTFVRFCTLDLRKERIEPLEIELFMFNKSYLDSTRRSKTTKLYYTKKSLTLLKTHNTGTDNTEKYLKKVNGSSRSTRRSFLSSFLEAELQQTLDKIGVEAQNDQARNTRFVEECSEQKFQRKIWPNDQSVYISVG